MCAELLFSKDSMKDISTRHKSCQKGKDSGVESAEDYSAYLNLATIGGQQPALKRTMRTHADAVYCESKIGLTVIGWIGMRLNYQNSSNFGHNSVYPRLRQSLGYFSSSEVNIYSWGYSYVKTLLIAFGTHYKRVSLLIKSRVAHVTGEVPCVKSRLCRNSAQRDDRGSVVSTPLAEKGPKYLTDPLGQVRSYATRSRKSKLATVEAHPVAIPKGIRILAKHWQTNHQFPNRVFYSFRGILKQESIWFAAYLKIKSNKGSKTPGPDGLTIDSLTKRRILELRQSVLNHEFYWTGVKEILIPKPGKPGRFRPLGIPSINDRLVQEVLRTIIEPIYELQFSDLSHGFRPNRSCHTALKLMNTRMKDSVWFVEGDIKSYFPTIDHEVLMKIMNKQIRDTYVLKLLRSGLKAKVFTKDKGVYAPELGTPQGGILSPLLSNIYLNELDKYMEELKAQYQGNVKPGGRKKNPQATKLLRTGLKSVYHRLRIPSRIHNEVDYRNCKYLRYADDFVIGVLGPRSMAIEIRDKVKDFLETELKIELSLEKTKITHVSKRGGGIEFLGYKFGRKTLFTRQKYGDKVVSRKMVIPRLDVNMTRVIARLSQSSFCDGNGIPTPAFRFLRLPQSETNNKVNYILKGLSEWWSIAGNRRQAIARVAYIIRYSIAKVYAAKFRLPTVASVFKIAGNDLSKPVGNRAKSVVGAGETDVPKGRKGQLKGILFDRYHKIPEPKGSKLKPNWIPEYLASLQKHQLNAEEYLKYIWDNSKTEARNPLAAMAWRLETAISRQGAPCAVCGSYEDVQMHHKNPLKNISKATDSTKRHEITIRRKQIPLCRKHHLEIHKGNWSEDPINVNETK